jgi:hypothetical protein
VAVDERAAERRALQHVQAAERLVGVVDARKPRPAAAHTRVEGAQVVGEQPGPPPTRPVHRPGIGGVPLGPGVEARLGRRPERVQPVEDGDQPGPVEPGVHQVEGAFDVGVLGRRPGAQQLQDVGHRSHPREAGSAGRP